MGDLTNPRLIYLKGGLFLVCGTLACLALILESPQVKTVALIAVVIWCFSRFHYFAFYVIQNYVDPGFQFAGLWAFATYLMSRRK